jgi:hypothetical protein
MDDYRSLSHTKWDCKYHVVFIPKCRRKSLYGQLCLGSAGSGVWPLFVSEWFRPSGGDFLRHRRSINPMFL